MSAQAAEIAAIITEEDSMYVLVRPSPLPPIEVDLHVRLHR